MNTRIALTPELSVLEVSKLREVRDLAVRPEARGKFLYLGEEKLWVKGVTYGTFGPEAEWGEYRTPELAGRDFAQMRANGLNAIRTYTVPPSWLLDLALEHHLWVMVGIPWEQHVDFCADRKRLHSIEQRVRRGVRACAGHPAVLCYAVGNEIPSPIVRWIGPRRVERLVERLCAAGREEDPEGLFTYVNYPSTEYLDLPFLDLVAFNVYLESKSAFRSYLARLQNLAGNRPLLMAEIGLDSRRNGDLAQAKTIDWQIRATFAAGSAGAFVFSWTDEWFRGGCSIKDWDFGLVRRDRTPKPALTTARTAFAQVPMSSESAWPRISVVVCSYNGSRTIRECLEGLKRVEYPDFEVIVVDDGSSDGTGEIASEYDVRLIQTENRGLSSARNTGMKAATGEIIAYTDDDAIPDPEWLTYLAHAFQTSGHAAIGGPNIAPAHGGLVAECVARSPGNPMHVLLSDEVAEHIPGCNFAVRKSALEAIDGFDAQFSIAGDDVDACWRLQERGWTLGFAPGAMVWHRRRDSLKTYWKQQRNYGRAEAMLERKWPEKYNGFGHVSWGGRIYGEQPRIWFGKRQRIYHGTWGSAPFQSIYEPAPGMLQLLPAIPEWHLFNFGIAAISCLGILWHPLLYWCAVLLLFSLLLPAAQTALTISRIRFPGERTPFGLRARRILVLTFLYFAQPIARLLGRVGYGLTPWRRRAMAELSAPRERQLSLWSEIWRSHEAWLQILEKAIRNEGPLVKHGGDFDRWDMEVQAGLLGSARVRAVVEEHGAGRQMVRLLSQPRYSVLTFGPLLLFVVLMVLALIDQAWLAAGVICGIAIACGGRAWLDLATAETCILRAAELLGFKKG